MSHRFDPRTYKDTLSPFPLYFTPLGKPAREVMEIDGVEYEMIWDGKELWLNRTDGKLDDGSNPALKDGLLIFMLLSSLVFWTVAAWYLGPMVWEMIKGR